MMSIFYRLLIENYKQENETHSFESTEGELVDVGNDTDGKPIRAFISNLGISEECALWVVSDFETGCQMGASCMGKIGAIHSARRTIEAHGDLAERRAFAIARYGSPPIEE